MAEAHKPGILAVAQKRLARTKTKVLQSLKKAERSTDESFDDLVLKTDKQHDVAHHLQKEIKAYVHCVRALSTACKSLTTALAQTYEAEWTDPAKFQDLLTAQTLLWDNYADNFQGSVIDPLSTYIASFPALKNKVAKRGRKMVDYDTARHNFEVLQEGKKKDEAKISKAQEDLNESKRIYEDLHAELCTELPDFYNSRVTFYADLFQKLYGCESQLHSELLKVSDSQTALAQKLSREYVEFVYTPKRPLSKSLSDNSGDENGPVNGESSPSPGRMDSAISSPSQAASLVKASSQPKSLARLPQGQGAAGGRKIHDEEEEDDDEMYSNQDVIKAAAKPNDTEQVGDYLVDSRHNKEDKGLEMNNVYEEPPGNADEDNDSDEGGLYQSPPSNQPVYKPPPNVLFIVEATHTYTGEDVDELCFEPGDIIYVVPYDDPEEQDEGWQMGIRQKDGIKGVFPENFTARQN